MAAVESVTYVGDKGVRRFALVTKRSGDKADLLVVDQNGTWTVLEDVPRRAPADYGPEGGGRTWH